MPFDPNPTGDLKQDLNFQELARGLAEIFSGDIRIGESNRYYIGTDVSLARHVSGQGFTMRQEGAQFFKLSLFRTDGATGSQTLAVVRAEAISDTAQSYDGGGMQIDQISNANDAETTRVRFFTCQAGASPVEVMRLNQLGQVGVGTTSPAASSVMEVASTTRGFMPPRMTEAQRDAIATPADGLVLYNTTASKLQVRAGGAWVSLH